MSEDITVQKIGWRVPMSFEQMLDLGLITEEQARAFGWVPPPPPPALTRWRWAVRSWWWERRPIVHLGVGESVSARPSRPHLRAGMAGGARHGHAHRHQTPGSSE